MANGTYWQARMYFTTELRWSPQKWEDFCNWLARRQLNPGSKLEWIFAAEEWEH